MKSSPVWATNSSFDKTPLPMNVFLFLKNDIFSNAFEIFTQSRFSTHMKKPSSGCEEYCNVHGSESSVKVFGCVNFVCTCSGLSAT